jgi:hypothetical protein
MMESTTAAMRAGSLESDQEDQVAVGSYVTKAFEMDPELAEALRLSLAEAESSAGPQSNNNNNNNGNNPGSGGGNGQGERGAEGKS